MAADKVSQNARLYRIEKQLDYITASLTDLSGSIRVLTANHAESNRRFETLEAEFSEIRTEVGENSSKLDTYKGMGIGIGTVVTVMTLVALLKSFGMV